MGLSIRKAAAALGVTHPALIKARNAGSFPVEPDGSVDLDRVRRSEWYRNHAATHPEIPHRPEPPKAQKPVASKPASLKPSAPKSERPAPPSTPAPRAGSKLDDLSKIDIEKLILIEKRKKLQRQNALDDRKLVELIKVNAWIAGCIVAFGTTCDRLVEELPDRFAHMTSPIEIKALLKRELDRARAKLSEYRA